ncbi:MAG: PKD domain-containing protein, partial [Chloroflexi bacterium]|nr:PKD domain-containing protein [Chloroflexota bacterium]
PTTGPVNATASFTATVNPISTTLPLTYTWEATGQTAVARAAASLADVVSFTWPVTGTQTITVSVSNAVGGPIIATHTFTVEMQTLYLPLMFQNWEAPAAWLEKP